MTSIATCSSISTPASRSARSNRSTRNSTRPYEPSSDTNAIDAAPVTATSATPATAATRAASWSRPIHATALGPGAFASTKTATAASTAFRTSVFGPAGAERSCPKQWQSGARPRAMLAAIATENMSSRPTATAAPARAVAAGSSSTAATSSAAGMTSASGPAAISGAPNATTASRVPRRSHSFAAPATANTALSSRQAINTSELVMSIERDGVEALAVEAVVVPLARRIAVAAVRGVCGTAAVTHCDTSGTTAHQD